MINYTSHECIFLFYSHLCCFLYQAESNPEGESPGKKRKTGEHNTDSSLEIGEEDSFSVAGDDEESELGSSFLDDRSTLEDIKENEEYSPKKVSFGEMKKSSSSQMKRSTAASSFGEVDLSGMLQHMNVSSNNRRNSSAATNLTGRFSSTNFTTKNAFICYPWKDKKPINF